MGMSSHVFGVRDLDGEFAKMMKVKLACDAAGVDFPQKIYDYFRPDHPGEGEDMLRREMESIDIEVAVSEYTRDGTDGFEVNLAKLPDGVKAIRFENSY